jgi:hypothetical protein
MNLNKNFLKSFFYCSVCYFHRNIKKTNYLIKYVHVRDRVWVGGWVCVCARTRTHASCTIYIFLHRCMCVYACVYECLYLFLQLVGRRKHKNTALYFLNCPQHRLCPLKCVSVCDNDPAESFHSCLILKKENIYIIQIE